MTLTATGAVHALDVVASVKPVHSLVAGVMEGVGEPDLLVRGAGSPHTYSMRPSEASMLEGADVVFWVGPNMEMFLADALDTLAAGATIVELGEADGLVRLAYREGGSFDAHAHDDDDDDAHDDHGHDHDGHDDEEAHGQDVHGHDRDDDGHGHEETQGHDDHGHEHAHGAYDMHFWLDPENAKTFVGAIEAALVEADRDNAETYAQNADALRDRLDGLLAETSEAVAGISDRRFVVFHDAYQYYESRFGVTATGSITVSPEVMPGAARIDEIRTQVRDLDVTCVFTEPQFEPRLIQVVTEGTEARVGVLDPLGSDLEDGPELYFDLIRNMTTSLTDCLGGEG